ncbi:hypothetical protein PENSPDRAFT_755960 [Peniophora sp. CONT]|nr:hypothetical protein PENSPDRAFT_755960 [Peniophora sp. CONT]
MSITTEAEKAGLYDPYFLSVILRGLDAVNGAQRLHSEPRKSKKLVERQARVLDSLAHLLATRPKHVVAVAAAKSVSGTGFDLLVAENETDQPPGATVDYLKDIFGRLREIYALWDDKDPGASRMPALVPSHATSNFERKVIELEWLVLQRAWPKLARRMGKNSRHMYFLETARDVHGKPALEREDLADDRERELLQSLQKLVLHDLGLAIGTLTHLTSTLDEDILRDKNTGDIRAFLFSAQSWRVEMQKGDNGKIWDDYTRSRQASKQPEAVLASHEIDIVRWLTKISSIRDHFHGVAKITTSKSLSSMLRLVEDITSVDLRTSTVPRLLRFNRERLLRVLCPVRRPETDVDDAKIYELLKSLQAFHGGTWTDSERTQLFIEFNGTVHCECLLLTKLHGRAAIPFIGLSKPSCALCYQYLATYRSIDGHQIRTLEAHDRAYPNWVFPTLEDRFSEMIRQTFCAEIRQRIYSAWRQYVRGVSTFHNYWGTDECMSVFEEAGEKEFVYGEYSPNQGAMVLEIQGVADTMQVDGDEPDGRAGVWDSDVGDELEYEVIRRMDRVAKALEISSPLRADVVILKEYETLLKALTGSTGPLSNEEASVVVTGQPGIGKTTFLLFLLLHRLERKQATALQVNSDYYLIFDAEGVVAVPISPLDDGDRLEKSRCWALVDSNEDVMIPCRRLRKHALRVVQTTSPKIERRQDWGKQHGARLYIMDLPDAMEIGAIAKEHRFHTSSTTLPLTLTYTNKWGPCTRTVLAILQEIDQEGDVDEVEERLRLAAETAADKILNAPSLLKAFSLEIDARSAGPVDGIGSGLLFVSPKRKRLPDGTVKLLRGSSIPIIPTKHLFNIFVEQLGLLDRQTAFQFFRTFNSHSHLRASAGWMLEGLPTTRTVPGTLDSLGDVAKTVDATFYWRPAATTFPGIDGVLGTADDGIYAVQAIIAHSHRSPVEGLEEIWPHIRKRVNARRLLHVVVIADEDAVARKLVAQFTKDLEGEKFRKKRTQSVVWGCVLSMI